MRRTVTLIAATATFLALAVPVLAGNAVGDRLNVFGGPVPSAGEPFHVVHGFTYSPGETEGGFQDPGNWDFILFVDGIEVRDAGKIVINNGDGTLSAGRVHNFPDGKSGTVVFEGVWYQSCAASTSECDPSAPPGSLYEALRIPREVTFSP